MLGSATRILLPMGLLVWLWRGLRQRDRDKARMACRRSVWFSGCLELKRSVIVGAIVYRDPCGDRLSLSGAM